MTYSDLSNLLNRVLPNAVYHLDAPPELERYIIWSEIGSRSEYAENTRLATIFQAGIYIYTQREDDSLIDTVCDALQAEDIAFGDPVPAYDDVNLTMGWVVECEFL